MTILEAAERKIYALRQGRTSGLEPLSRIMNDVYARLSEAPKAAAGIRASPAASTTSTARSWA
jgi:hypothetical protein